MIQGYRCLLCSERTWIAKLWTYKKKEIMHCGCYKMQCIPFSVTGCWIWICLWNDKANVRILLICLSWVFPINMVKAVSLELRVADAGIHGYGMYGVATSLLLLQGSCLSEGSKFHNFSMTFHDQILIFPWPFCAVNQINLWL